MSDFEFSEGKEFSRFTLGRAEVMNARFGEVAQAVATKLDKSGGTIEGSLEINSEPTDPKDAITVGYLKARLPGRVTISTGLPSGGSDGDIHFRVLP